MKTITPEMEDVLDMLAGPRGERAGDPWLLADEKLRLVNSGDHAAVYRHPSRDDLVVRISDVPDGWFAYATGAVQPGRLGRYPDGLSSIHVPRLHGLCCITLSDDARNGHRWLAITERLEPCRKNDPVILAAQRVLDPIEYGEPTGADRHLVERAAPGLLALADAWGGRLHDFQASNWMMRGDTFVLNDPIAMMESLPQIASLSRALAYPGEWEAEPQRESACAF